MKARMHTHANTYTHKYTRACTYTHTHTNTHTHTHTHNHPQALSQVWVIIALDDQIEQQVVKDMWTRKFYG